MGSNPITRSKVGKIQPFIFKNAIRKVLMSPCYRSFQCQSEPMRSLVPLYILVRISLASRK